MPSYVPLWCKSNFSFLEGASHPEELIEAAAQHGIEAIALTDRDGVYGAVEAHVKARELGVKLILGSEVTIDDASTLVLLAMNRSRMPKALQMYLGHSCRDTCSTIQSGFLVSSADSPPVDRLNELRTALISAATIGKTHVCEEVA